MTKRNELYWLQYAVNGVLGVLEDDGMPATKISDGIVSILDGDSEILFEVRVLKVPRD